MNYICDDVALSIYQKFNKLKKRIKKAEFKKMEMALKQITQFILYKLDLKGFGWVTRNFDWRGNIFDIIFKDIFTYFLLKKAKEI